MELTLYGPQPVEIGERGTSLKRKSQPIKGSLSDMSPVRLLDVITVCGYQP